MSTRVRFAPSPTGYLHVGGARTALFNWFYARHTGGVMILRIEDTDEERNTPEANQAIFDGLRWLGIDWDEGPGTGGGAGPYRQSERVEIYDRYFARLEAAGLVYEDEGAMRFKAPNDPVTIDDLVCGKVVFDGRHDPDMTVRRADGSYIFHFVSVVDDIEMKISHVIRGEDHLSNTPKHIDLYRAFDAAPPRFAHIPLILNSDGSKMSKRDRGASIQEYIEGGFQPEAVLNYICLLGWSPKDDREILATDEIKALFDLPQINRSHARFDMEKCLWMNQQYLLRMTPGEFADAASAFLENKGTRLETLSDPGKVLGLFREKLRCFGELPEKLAPFLGAEVDYDPEALEKVRSREGAVQLLGALKSNFESAGPWTEESLESLVKASASDAEVKPGALMFPLRFAASGTPHGPSLYPMLELLGKETVIHRIAKAIELLKD